MKILIASSSPPDRGSGINAYVKELAAVLREMQHEVHLLSPEPRDYSWLKQHGVIHCPTGHLEVPILAVKRIHDYLVEHDFDYAINNDNPFLQCLAPALHFPLVSVGHMSKTSVATLACWQHEWTDYMVAISQDMQHVFTGKYHVPITKCPVVYSGIVDRKDMMHTAQKLEDTRLVAVYAGGNNRMKGSDLMLQSVLSSPDIWNNTVLHWYGNVPDKIKARVSGMQHVIFHGRVSREEFIKQLAESHLFFLPSRLEGCPVALLEAMSFGVVAITSNGIGAMNYMVRSGQDGFICDLKSWPEQANTCLRYFTGNAERLKIISDSARQRYLSEFQMKHTAERILALLANPTVDRRKRLNKIQLLRWHRPLLPGSDAAPFLDRIAIRLGYLRKSGFICL